MLHADLTLSQLLSVSKFWTFCGYSTPSRWHNKEVFSIYVVAAYSLPKYAATIYIENTSLLCQHGGVPYPQKILEFLVGFRMDITAFIEEALYIHFFVNAVRSCWFTSFIQKLVVNTTGTHKFQKVSCVCRMYDNDLPHHHSPVQISSGKWIHLNSDGISWHVPPCNWLKQENAVPQECNHWIVEKTTIFNDWISAKEVSSCFYPFLLPSR